MKKAKLLNSILVSPLALTALSPMLMMTGCSQQQVLNQLEKATINEFTKLCEIPHSSDKFLYLVPYESNVMKLSNYIKNRVTQLISTEVHQDKFGNIWFDVECNDESLKDAPTIALQCHMDMVFTYDKSKYKPGEEPDPVTTKIELVGDVKEGKRVIHSKDYKTTIGADNGIGVAAVLALIGNKNVKHGNLRVIFTNCEENAMQGAVMMVEGVQDTIHGRFVEPTAPAVLKNIDYVLNLDGGLGNALCVGCSGAVGSYYAQDYDIKETTLENKFEMKISGFSGGHSGGAVRQFCGNAIKAANETLEYLKTNKNGKFEISSITTSGTEVYNRVPPNCEISFATNLDQSDIVNAFNQVISNHNVAEKESPGRWKDGINATISVQQANFAYALSEDDSNKIIALQSQLPYGRDESYESQNLKSSANIGPANLFIENSGWYKYTLETYARSDSETKIQEYQKNASDAAKNNNFIYADTKFHPWAGDNNKKLYNLTVDSLKTIGIGDVKPTTGHGGIEPAMLSWAMIHNNFNYNGNSVSIGINVKNEHEFTEEIDVESIIPCMKVIQNIFANALKLK